MSLPETYSRSTVAITRIPFFLDIRRDESYDFLAKFSYLRHVAETVRRRLKLRPVFSGELIVLKIDFPCLREELSKFFIGSHS
jgi:hypothetical protein